MLNEIYQNLDPIAFAIGPVTVRWYGIAYILGFACAALVIWRLAKRWRVRVDEDARRIDVDLPAGLLDL